MRFDDRLKTVMTQPVADAHDRTVRWRQLVDLLSRPHEHIDPALLDAALTMIRIGMRSVARVTRAATARSIAGRAAEPRLIAIFAADKLQVAAPLLAAARLDEQGWTTVLSEASEEVAAFIATIRGGSSSAPPSDRQGPSDIAESHEPSPSIGEMVARIERLKNRRDSEPAADQGRVPAPGTEPALPARRVTAGNGGLARLFRWECDASGQIGWVEGVPRGALIGRSLPAEEGATRELVRAFADHLPFEDAPLTFPAPALNGEWRLSGMPAFSPVDGRFLGYRGVARQEGKEASAPQLLAQEADAESLRETIHEIKTPLNAIIGFAEIIDGQYLGPAHRSYRYRAAEIVAQARLLLAAIEDLDFAARLQADRSQASGEGTDFNQFFPRMAEEANRYGASRGVGIVYQLSGQFARCGLAPDLSERLVRRFFEALIDSSAPGESLSVVVSPEMGSCVVAIDRPAALRHFNEADLLNPGFAIEGDAQLGIGFALRLVRGMVRLAGGDLRIGKARFALLLPGKR
ncbi:MAG TPA: histidine kinase dimerization/phospho-acceptor domain-containing protein [Sphingomicrobium sp.]|nr:histidine kinase dimerization/phospho-acceptor domain-containing protein [Sphingomicrobium sp.]